jgi:23S rRNA (cytosine1962-C5)-methyltransferase/23S rRNA (guanine2445-N2)-methyltransferase / 23S rRNA (guanine2069-N7)-methyltransferase
MSEIKNRIEKNAKNLKLWSEKHQIEAYRLYDRDIPEYPYIVDRYKDHFVIFDRGDERIDSREDKQGHFPELMQALSELFSARAENIIVKKRARQKGDSQYEKTSQTNRTLKVREGQAVFIVNLYDYLDTGLFLDHRLMRQKIFKEAAGKDFLNLFAYTGSVSVFAALGGARSTVSVDMSATYSRWAQDNFIANQIPLSNHEFITEDALQYLTNPHEKRHFDLIFLDPPTFSNSKRMEQSFEVEREQEFLVENAMRLLKPGGLLYFSNNKRTFKLSPELMGRFNINNITAKTIPKDMRDQKIHQVFAIKTLA